MSDNVEKIDVEAIERALRTRERLARAFKRVLQMPTHRMALSADSIILVQTDLRRVIAHAVKLGWLKANAMEGVKDGSSPDPEGR